MMKGGFASSRSRRRTTATHAGSLPSCSTKRRPFGRTIDEFAKGPSAPRILPP
jgi:hypothetical protein